MDMFEATVGAETQSLMLLRERPTMPHGENAAWRKRLTVKVTGVKEIGGPVS